MNTRLPLICAALVAWAAPAAAQLDLPDRPARPKSDRAAVELDRGVRNSLAERINAEEGRKQGKDVTRQGLDLPDRLPARRDPKREATPATPPSAGPGREVAPDHPRGSRPLGSPIAFIFDSTSKVRDLAGSNLIDEAVTRLAAKGEPARAAAREELWGDNAARILTAGRVLLASPEPQDVQSVLDRVREGRLPRNQAGPLVQLLIDSEPSRVPLEFLVDLLGHPQAAVRAVGQHGLEDRADPRCYPLLGQLRNARRTDTRLRALLVAESIGAPERIDHLLACLADGSPQVAYHAVQSLAGEAAPQVERELLARVFGDRWILREGAYALLTILEREDLYFEKILDESHQEALLLGLARDDFFVAGTCAAALAGLGFHSPRSSQADWLDRQVPHALVRTVSGREFHSDFGSLRRTAQRRLALISGENFGADGPEWLKWWAENARDFRARRVHLDVSAEDAGGLRFFVARNLDDRDFFELIGPDVVASLYDVEESESAWDEGFRGEHVFLTQGEAVGLFHTLEAQGVFGGERIPGARGAVQSGYREAVVLVGDGGKSFRFGPGESEPWFESLLEVADAVRHRNRWQRFVGIASDADRYRAWSEEAPWWQGDHDSRERALRMKGHVLASLSELPLAQRQFAIDELERIYAEPKVASPGDFVTLVALLRQEPTLGSSARRLVGLALEAGASARASESTLTLPEDLREDLVAALIETFGASSAREVSRVLQYGDRAGLAAAVEDPRPFLRAVAAATLAEDPNEEDVELLTVLLRDPVEEVELAAIDALGENRADEVLTDLLVRARLGTHAVRVSALRAIGRIGGEGVLDTLMTGLAEPDVQIKIAATRGMIELEDPTTVPLFLSFLREGRSSPLYEVARDGLMAFGEEAWDDLLRVVNSPGHESQRDAALLLARQGVPQAAPVLMTILSENRADAFVASELAVLTCIDMRGLGDPSGGWWEWWDQVVHNDSQAWLVAALERREIHCPPSEEFRGAGSRHAALCLLEVLEAEGGPVVERCRRSLGRMLGRDLGPLPSSGAPRIQWISTLRDTIDEHFAEAGVGSSESAPPSIPR